MARIGNETKLILKLAKQRHEEQQRSRVQTPCKDYVLGYNRCFEDIWFILNNIVQEIES